MKPKMDSKSLLFLLGIIIIVFNSCSEREKLYSFHYLEDKVLDKGDVLKYDIDITDSNTTYTALFAGRFDKDFTPQSIAFQIVLLSPSGKKYQENLTFPTNFKSLKKDSRIELYKSNGANDIQWKYRENITPKEYGTWTIMVSLPSDATAIDGICGLGVSVQPNNSHNERKR